jgi:hypothetical protein
VATGDRERGKGRKGAAAEVFTPSRAASRFSLLPRRRDVRGQPLGGDVNQPPLFDLGIDLEQPRPIVSTLPDEGVSLYDELRRYQEWLIEQALIRSGGKRAGAARLLGLKRTTLVMMLKAQAATMRTGARCRSPGERDGLTVAARVLEVEEDGKWSDAGSGCPGLPARDVSVATSRGRFCQINVSEPDGDHVGGERRFTRTALSRPSACVSRFVSRPWHGSRTTSGHIPRPAPVSISRVNASRKDVHFHPAARLRILPWEGSRSAPHGPTSERPPSSQLGGPSSLVDDACG